MISRQSAWPSPQAVTPCRSNVHGWLQAVRGGGRGVQAQAGEAVSEVQRAWRKHEAVRRELAEARIAWDAERQELLAQVHLLQHHLRQQARLGAAGTRGGFSGSGGSGSGGSDGFHLKSEDVASSPPGAEPLSTAAMLLPPPPWELQTASSIASWQVPPVHERIKLCQLCDLAGGCAALRSHSVSDPVSCM